MVTIVDDLESLSLQEPIFKDVKYYLSGDVSEKILVLLQSGGAESTKYFSDYVTHLICGQNATDTDIEEAQDVYQIPAVTESWVLACVRLKKLAHPSPYFPNKSKIFSNVVACVAKVSLADAKTLFALISFHGGKVTLNLNSQCTHLICGSASGKRYSAALSLPVSKLKIVTPDWVLESIRARIQAVAEVFHPKLLVVPQPPLKMDRISAITGFDFEEGIAKNEVPTQNMAENKDESTQALLDKLKQRMPWNHPPSSANTVTTSAQNLAMKQSLISQQTASQAVQNIAQQLAQSTQHLQQNKLNQNLGQPQIINQQIISTGQQLSSQSQGMVQQQTVQSMTNQQQNLNMGGNQGLVTSQASNQQVQLNQLINSGQQIGQQIQTVQQTIQPGSNVQGAWRQQNIQMVQGQHQIIRSPLVQTRNPQNQVILQQQIMQTQQGLINNQQQQLSPQHTIQQTSQQILQQSIGSQGQTISQTHHQILVQKQQLLGNSGQQQIVQAPQQVLINQHTGQQQILVHGNQQVTLQGGQQIVSQSQIVHQGQVVNQGQQIITQGGQQVLSQGGQHVITQQGQQHQVVIAQSSQQIVTQSGQQIIGQAVGQNQQVLSQVPQSPQSQQLSSGGIQQIITHGGGQQIVSPGGQGLIHLDAATHAQLQQMDPAQRAMFVAQLQKRRQLSIQRAQALKHQGQPGVVQGSPGSASPSAAPQSVTFIRSQLPPGLTPQQQVQWLQQQGARATTIPAASPAQTPQSPVGGQPVASPGSVGSQVQAGVTQHVAGSPLPEQQVDAALLTATPEQQQNANNALLVNPKTKTALANMLSIRLQGAAPPPEHEPSAAGTLRLMTAAHAAGGAVRAPARLLLGPAHHPHQQTAAGSVVGGKVYAGVRAPPPRAQFYGHNPNLKLPPDLFLLGCVFHIVEYQRTWGAERVARWAECIARRGGEVEQNYCARVTHVLCETQKHGVVMQALRDAKRCVTAYWLSDAMLRRGVAPPWQALHLPSMYAARDRPAKHHRVAISGWRGDERDRVLAQIEHIGAKLTPYMTRDNTVLICKRAEGNKYRRAREWNIPVVTAHWLTDLLLGNMSALSQIENAKYQQFNMPSPFRMDYSLVSHLMNAWKMPINITQESHERAKRAAAAITGAPKRKKPRLDIAPVPTLQPVQTPPLHLAPRVLFSAVPLHEQNKLAAIVRVLFSAVPLHEQNKLAAIVRQLGGLIVTSAQEATHLVMDKLVRTSKLISCLVTVKHLLTPEWILESQRLNKFADEAKHGLKDEAFNKMFKCDIQEVLLCGEQRRKIFEGVTFFLTPCVKPSRGQLTEMIELCGGKVEKNRRSYVSIQEMHTQKPYSYLVLTVPNDLHLVYYLLQSEKTLNVVCSTEVVLSAIMRQKLEVEEFLVKID
ncbi:twin BRCT domain-containing protein [Phthorimaea operculella]|nr:twin BRCT domain-containing protein [Phthorimaea operculella]